jgi:hypothetical protein
MENTNNPQDIITRLAQLSKETHELLQDPYFDNLAISKKIRLEQKLAERGVQETGRVYLGRHLEHARPLDGSCEYVHLPENFLLDPPKDVPKNSIFILLNNDVAPYINQYLAYYNSTPNALFVIWDWDSQHWIYMSSLLAMNSDFYISGTSENAFLLSHLSPHVLGPVFVAAHQWPRKFILEHIDLFLKDRIDTPLGMHVFYQQYPKRNRAIATVSKTYATVGFTNNDYKLRTEEENFREWAQHKTHWIMPVLSGVPIRVYNALITGGIPILPSFYKNLPEIEVLGEHPMYYEVADLVEPKMINEAAVARFDAAGESGLIQRICEAVEKHHIDTRCDAIIKAVDDAARKIANRDRSHTTGYLGVKS